MEVARHGMRGRVRTIIVEAHTKDRWHGDGLYLSRNLFQGRERVSQS